MLRELLNDIDEGLCYVAPQAILLQQPGGEKKSVAAGGVRTSRPSTSPCGGTLAAARCVLQASIGQRAQVVQFTTRTHRLTFQSPTRYLTDLRLGRVRLWVGGFELAPTGQTKRSAVLDLRPASCPSTQPVGTRSQAENKRPFRWLGRVWAGGGRASYRTPTLWPRLGRLSTGLHLTVR